MDREPLPPYLRYTGNGSEIVELRPDRCPVGHEWPHGVGGRVQVTNGSDPGSNAATGRVWRCQVQVEGRDCDLKIHRDEWVAAGMP